VQGSPGDANSHVEMRMGEPAANPYLYMAANIAAGLDGMRRQLDPPPPVEADPYSTQNQMLPTSLSEAIGALEQDGFYRKAFGDTIVDYLLQMKRKEFGRYEAALADKPLAEGQEVSDWEMNEYFEFY
jgi:glutamine synthetase